MKSLMIKPKVQLTWMLLLLLNQQLLLAQDHHDHERHQHNHHHHNQHNHHQRHHNFTSSSNGNNNLKLTSAQLVAQKAENHHHYNYQHKQQQVKPQVEEVEKEEDGERVQRHHQHNKHNNHQRQNAINSSAASKSSLAHQQYYQQSSTIRPLTGHHNSQQQQQQQHHTSVVKQAHNHHHYHQHEQPHTNAHLQHQTHNQRHAHDQFSQTSPPSVVYQHHNFERQQRLLVQEPNINYNVVGSNNWLADSMTERTHAHMTGNHVDADDDIYAADSNDYYDDMRENADDYGEQEYARVARHLPDSEYADDESYRQETGILSKQKFQELGTKESVNLARDNYLTEIRRLNHRLADDHYKRMIVAAQCSRPMPRVVRVSNLTKRRYAPSCTILHRCGEDTGCCNATQICAVKSSETVKLYFYVYGIDVKGTAYEELELTNHTECQCVNRYNMQRSKRSGANHFQQQPNLNSFDGLQQTAELFKSSPSAPFAAYRQSAELTELTAVDKAIKGKQQICHCPKHFDVFVAQQNLSRLSTVSAHQWQTRTTEDCRCDCMSINLPCQRLRDGKEGFPVEDRKCMATRRCRRPSCKHGEYNHQMGRCPRHKDTHNDYGSYG